MPIEFTETNPRPTSITKDTKFSALIEEVDAIASKMLQSEDSFEICVRWGKRKVCISYDSVA